MIDLKIKTKTFESPIYPNGRFNFALNHLFNAADFIYLAYGNIANLQQNHTIKSI